MRGDKLAKREPVRIWVAGFPGTAKTGGTVTPLLELGYKVRVLDFDGNIAPVLQFVKPEFLQNLDVVTLEDKLRAGEKFIEPSGIPDAFQRGLKLMDEWAYKDDDGSEVNLGKSKDWGCDTVVVLDSNTKMGNAAQRRQMSIMNKTLSNNTQQTWYIAMNQQEAFIERLVNRNNRFHVVILSHLQLIGPKDIANGDDDLTKELKERTAAVVPTKLFPKALGRELSPLIAGHVPNLIRFETDPRGERIIRTLPQPEMDLKLALPNAKEFDKAKISDGGFGKIFKALAPPLSECLGK
jgi:hypothetical protein